MNRLGLIVNPIAGMGGRVGLKGTDGAETLTKAEELGATPVSPDRTKRALRQCLPIREAIDLVTYPDPMGEREARRTGFDPTVVGEVDPDRTTARDTRRAARNLRDANVDLLLFAGGDGTARDVHRAIDADVPALGIPTGVKIHSGIFAVTPESAGELARKYLSSDSSVDLRRGEVMDIDEQAFREGRVSAELYGYLTVPYERRLVQNTKSGSASSESIEDIAKSVVEGMANDRLYLVGPGTTTGAIMDQLRLEGSLLGVDAVLNGRLLGTDLNETGILALLDEHHGTAVSIVVSVVGGQGFIFGRGNQQFSPDVVDRVGRDNIIVVASEEKLAALAGSPLRVDTGSAAMDEHLSGYMRVITGYGKQVVYEVRS